MPSLIERIKLYWQVDAESFERYYGNAGFSGWIINVFLNKRQAKISSLVKIENNQALLDIGCGSGHLIANFAKKGAKVAGLDYSWQSLLLAKDRLKQAGIKGNNLILADAAYLPIRDKYYDFVVCAGVLDYVSDTRSVIIEIKRVLKDTGLAVLTIPKRNTPFFIFRLRLGEFLRKALFGLPPILTAISKKDLVELVNEIGFRVEKVEQLFYTMWLISLKKI